MTKHQRRMWRLLKINARSLKGMRGWQGSWLRRWSHALWHATVGPKTGCSCTFCFYSRRRYCPPGHPEHAVQIEVRVTKLERGEHWENVITRANRAASRAHAKATEKPL